MEFVDDAADVDEEDVLVPSSQQPISSSDRVRPAKRRRLNTYPEDEDDSASSSQDDEYDLPSRDGRDDDDDKFGQPRSKYDSFMHVPVHVDSQRDEFYTQIEQPGSSPSAIRGPRWRKKSPPIPTPVIENQLRSICRNVVTPATTAVTAKPIPSEVDDFDEFDDGGNDEFFEALAAGHSLENNVADHGSSASAKQSSFNRAQKSFRQTTLFGLDTTTQRTPPRGTQARVHNWPATNRNEPPTHHKIDKEAMKSWVYPLNVGSIRDYQFNIVHRALFHNILVALPTGLGKTFIAATVMLNYFRWTREAQIVFVAPTKPLVTQQVDACFHIAGIPRSQTTLLTGEVSPAIRAEEWQEKRVFFMTPQTLINDLKNGMADPKKIVLVVVDEAHKATGNYAYVEVVKFLRRFNSSFRVLALTATPGSTVEAVQKVVDGLDIARVEIRTEESMDIRSYVHTRKTELQIFDNSEEVEMCLELFAAAVKPVLNKVASLNVYFSSDPRTMTLFGLMKGRERWSHSEAGRNANWGLKATINACFKPLMSLAHNAELLKFHGIGPFYHKMKEFEDESGNGKYAQQIKESESFKLLMSRTRSWINGEDFIGHPKLSYLNEVVLNHFLDAGNGLDNGSGVVAPSNTRIMIFAHYRDSAEEIARVLNRHQPMIRAHVFVGQQGTKGSAGMDQKTQIDIIKKFKAGTYNTLVATSIGEEGLDIGEVDLIVCYDCSKSPVRMLQRMGRTGRKRAGKIVLLLMRGKEERDYHAAKDNYLKMQEIIERGTEFVFHEENSPRIVPREIQPVVDKRIVEIPIENTQLGDLDPRKRKPKIAKRPPKKFNMPDGVETGFTFLGGSKSKKSKANPTFPKPVTDLEIADLPDLGTILLTAEEENDLDHRYAQVAGDGMVYVQQVRLDAHPTQVRQLCKTNIVRHSGLTKALVRASEAMRTFNRDWTRPMVIDNIVDLSQPSVNSDTRRAATKRSTKAVKGRKSAAALHKPQQPPKHDQIDSDQYDANDSFVDDEPLTQQGLTSSSAFESSAPIVSISRTRDTQKRHLINDHPSNDSDESEEEDLPEMIDIIKGHSDPVSRQGQHQRLPEDAEVENQGARNIRKHARWVVDDSDDSDLSV